MIEAVFVIMVLGTMLMGLFGALFLLCWILIIGLHLLLIPFREQRVNSSSQDVE